MLIQPNKVSLSLLLFFLMFARVYSKPVLTRDDVVGYLWKYGYLHPLAINGGLDENATREALKDFQSFAGLNITGELDQHVLKVMSQPRCGLADKIFPKINKIVKRFVVSKNRQHEFDMIYNITSYPNQLSRADVDAEIAKAFAMWSENSDLTFTHDKTNRGHIEIKFVENEHDDGIPFDGEGGSLAHTISPKCGNEIHFDKAEVWTIGSDEGANLLYVAVHEIGHFLGLNHSDLESSVMYPFYRGFVPDLELDNDDIDGIQYLYGPKSYELCRNPKIDTIFNTVDGHIYAFRGKHYFEILENSLPDYPKLISERWPGLPDNIDAAFTYKDGKTYFFKHEKYWRYNGRKLNRSFPRNIRKDFGNIPTHLDAAMVWGRTRTILFFKGHKFWSVTPRNGRKYSIDLTRVANFKGLPRNIDAAFQHTNGSKYFFKGDKYYQLNNKTYHVDKAVPPYPRPSAKWWFGC